jgi:hypothetical protein
MPGESEERWTGSRGCWLCRSIAFAFNCVRVHFIIHSCSGSPIDIALLTQQMQSQYARHKHTRHRTTYRTAAQHNNGQAKGAITRVKAQDGGGGAIANGETSEREKK